MSSQTQETNISAASGTASASEPLRAQPLHGQVGDRILERIAAGEWPEGFVLPAETELARNFGVSLGTIRRAMADLTRQGVVMPRRRHGTVVTGRKPQHTLERFYRYYRLHGEEGQLLLSNTKVLRVSTRDATELEATALEVAPKASIREVIRVRSVDDEPVMIDYITIPLDRIIDFPDHRDSVPKLIYAWLLRHRGLRLAAVREQLSATLATPEEVRLLALDPKTQHPLLRIDEIAFDTHNNPMLLMRHSARTEKQAYVNELQ